jgi:hypothetical protein
MSTSPTKMSINYNPHFLLLQDYFPAVANWLKWRSYICRQQEVKCPFTLWAIIMRIMSYISAVFKNVTLNEGILWVGDTHISNVTVTLNSLWITGALIYHFTAVTAVQSLWLYLHCETQYCHSHSQSSGPLTVHNVLAVNEVRLSKHRWLVFSKEVATPMQV